LIFINEEFYALAVDSANRHDAARAAVKDAENALIEYGLSIAPVEIRETLRKESRRILTIRERLIDLVMRLDTRTVKA
jgi:hypothetical protein